jgi:hypothetical protein
MAKTQKFSVIIDSSGAVVGAFAALTEKQSADAVQSGVDAAPGQSLHEIDVSEEVSKLEGTELLLQLSKTEKIRDILSNIPSSGFVSIQSALPETQRMADFPVGQVVTATTVQMTDASGVVAGQAA